MADDNKELKNNELNDVNGGVQLRAAGKGLVLADGASAPLADSAAIGFADAARVPLAAAGVALADATRPKFPFTSLEEANIFAQNAGMAVFETLEAANNWLNTGNRASLS